MNDLIRIHESDMVAVALRPLRAGENVPVSGAGFSLAVAEDIPMGHKAALRNIAKGEKVIKYGFPIGEAAEDIPMGCHVHTHNLRTLLSGALEYRYHPSHPRELSAPEDTFPGFLRPDGRVGVRNELWIIPSVGCVNDVAEKLAAEAGSLISDHVTNVRAFTHPYGCSQLGDDQEHTRQILANLCVHPNAGGVLLLGLGCENSSVAEIVRHMPPHDGSRIRTLICQDVPDEVAAGTALLRELAALMEEDSRTPCPVSALTVGLKCGGSDGLSGITANPSIGGFSDLLIARGGSTILTEVPEMFGAETILMDRCENEEVFRRTVRLINDFKAYFESCGQPVYENPSPGNKAGGITTLEDKALGCTQKSGSAKVSDVLSYGERVRRKGLSLLSAPGNDLVASTALAAAGAQIVLFSTGRGTPFGCPVPTVKISSNSPLAAKKANWIDFNAGTLVEGGTLEEKAAALYDFVLAVAGGEKTRNEINGFQGLAIFKTGATL